MRRTLTAIVWLGIWLSIPGSVFASSAWWVLCDSCTTDTAFRHQALNAPGSYTPIYVTNRETNETRKYNRWTFLEDFDTGVVQWTEVVTADFPVTEKSVFQQAVQDASRLVAPISRSDLSGVLLGTDVPSSVVRDISDGRLRASYFSQIRLHLEDNGYLPDFESVSRDLGVDTPIGGLSGGVGNTIRKRSLIIIVSYDDGSRVSLVRLPDGTLVEIEVLDADGNLIPVQGQQDNGSVPIATTEFNGIRLGFGQGPGNALALEALADRIGGTGSGLDCHVSGSGNTLTLTCTKVK
ncbi:MAG: hypothetical protein WD397_00685 [Wenzhouxiangellaceae bacterium]